MQNRNYITYWNVTRRWLKMTGNMHDIYAEVQLCSFWDIWMDRQTLKQTNRHTHNSTVHPSQDRVKMQCFMQVAAVNRERLGRNKLQNQYWNWQNRVTSKLPNSQVKSKVFTLVDFRVILFLGKVVSTNPSDSQVYYWYFAHVGTNAEKTMNPACCAVTHTQ